MARHKIDTSHEALVARNAVYIERKRVEAELLAAQPVVDRNGVPIEPGQLIEYADQYQGPKRRAWVTEVTPSWAMASWDGSPRKRQTEYDQVSLESWGGVFGGKVSHGCRASEAEVLKLTPGELTHQRLLDVDVQVAQVDKQEVALRQHKVELLRERSRLERIWHSE